MSNLSDLPAVRDALQALAPGVKIEPKVMKTKRQNRIVSVDFCPALNRVWIERLPLPLPRGYCGGRKVKCYKHPTRWTVLLFAKLIRAGFVDRKDSNGVHVQHPDFSTFKPI